MLSYSVSTASRFFCSFKFSLLTACPASLLVFSLGCEPPPRPVLRNSVPGAERSWEKEEPKPEFASMNEELGEIPLKYSTEVPLETWDVYFLGGEQIGYSHMQAEFTDRSDEILYRTTERIQIRRGEQILDQELRQSSIETVTGRLRKFDSEMLSGSQRTSTRGIVQRNELLLTTEKDGEQVERKIKWQPSNGGFHSLQQQLIEKPMKKGEKRSLTLLAPLLYVVGELRLEAIGMASVPMLTEESKPLKLLEVASKSYINGQEVFTMTLWTDEDGNILKQHSPAQNLIIVRADEETAKNFIAPEMDVLRTFSIPLAKKIEDANDLSRAGYVVKAKDDLDLGTVFKDLPGQKVRLEQDGSMQIAVFRNVKDKDSPLEPAAGDRDQGPLIQSKDNLIRELAKRPGNVAKAQLAKDLSRIVYDHISKKDLGAGFDSAAMVAINASGDCTEHSVLLAALCRARGIPARLAAGLVYVDTPEGPAMRYHMWTLAYVNDRWLPLDAMQPSGLAAADRITIATDDLADGSEFDIVSGVASVMGRIEVEAGKTMPGLAAEIAEIEKNGSNPLNSAPTGSKDSADLLDNLLQDMDFDLKD